MAERTRVRDLTSVERDEIPRIVRRGSGPAARWPRARIVLRSARAMNVPAIARIAFASGDVKRPGQRVERRDEARAFGYDAVIVSQHRRRLRFRMVPR